MIDQQDAIKMEEVLSEVMPEACQIVGRSTLRDIVRRGGDVHLASLDGASRLDWALDISLLAAGAAILNHGLGALKNLTEKRKNRAEIAVEIKVSIPQELAGKLESQTIDKLLDCLLSRG